MKTKIIIQNHKTEKAGKLKMYFNFYIIDNLEYLEVWEDGECVNTLTQPFCENVLKLVNDDSLILFEAGTYVRSFFLFWADGKELDKKILQIPIPAFHIMIEVIEREPVEVLYPESFNEIMFYIIIKIRQKIAEKRLWVIRCNRCKRIFVNYKYGRKVMYCDYKNEHGESCHDTIAYYAEGKNKTEVERHLQKVFIRYYDEQRRKRKKKTITKEQVVIWSKNARAMRDLCVKGEITEEAFVKWLGENKDNYTEP